MTQQTSPPRLRPVIRVFVSSTFSDMKHERNALQADVFPRLEQLCLKNGFQFQAIDLRWGVSTEAGLDHRAMRICFDELRRAQQISPEPNFLILLGNRYGWRPLPEAISAIEFEALKNAASKISTSSANGKPTIAPGLDPLAVLQAWYRCDENIVLPETPETDPDRIPLNYLLQSRYQNLGDERDYTRRKDDPKEDTQDWLDVQEVLWSLINIAFPVTRPWLEGVDWARHIAEVNDPLHPKRAIPQIARFQASATEQEVWCGALSESNADRHVVACFRKISNRDDFAATEVKEFFDVVEEKFDQAPARCLSNLKEVIRLRLGDNKPLNIPFMLLKREKDKVLLDASESDTQAFCDAVYEKFRPIIERQIEEYWDKSAKDFPARTARELEIEQREYERFAQERGGEESFVGRKDELQAILDYVESYSPWPLVIHGASGCGKTALLARASQEVAKTRKRIERFIGVAPRSSDLRSLLSSLCQELRQWNPRPDPLPIEMKELRDEFVQHLHAAMPGQPLILFLDALDQLADADGGRSLHWIPWGQLRPNVKFVVSCLSDRENNPAGQPWIELQKRQIPTGNLINLDALSEPEAKTLLFDRWLHQAKRTLSPSQRTKIKQLLASPACRQPIYLKLLFEEIHLWRSYDPAPVPGDSVPALLGQLFDRLSQPTNHGPLLVHRVLGFLCASRQGLAENEILEILFADPEYRAKLDEAIDQTRHGLPPNAKCIPITLWSRLRFDLAPYLTERAVPGANVLTFYHRQVAEWVHTYFTAAPDQAWQPHRRLADYFRSLADPEKNQSWSGDSPRPFLQLAFHLSRTDANELSRLLFDFNWLQAKTDKTLVFDLIDDYDEALRALPASHPQRYALTLVQSSLKLSSTAISGDRARLPNRLLGRLLGDSSTDIARLLDAAVRHGGEGEPWLRPLKRCLPLAPGALVAAAKSHHIDSLRGLALTPDGTKLISWDCDAVCVWSSDELRFLGRTRAPGRTTIKALAPLPDGWRVAYAMNEECPNIYLWDFDNDSTTELAVNRKRIRSLAAAGDLLMAAGGDEPPTVWSLSQGKRVGQLDCPAEADDGTAAPAAVPGTYRLAELPVTREPVRIHAIAASPDGAAFLGVARAQGQSWLVRWSLPDCHLAYAQPIALQSYSDWLTIQITRDSRYCIVSGSNQVLLFEAESGEAFRVLTGHANEVMSFALASDWLFAVDNSDTLKVWDVATNECLATIQDSGISNVAATHNGRPVVVRYGFHLELWEKHTLELGSHAGADFAGPVSTVVMDHGGTVFIATADGQPAAMWRDGKLLSIPLDAPVRYLAISADNQYLFLATTDSLVMWSVRERRVLGNLGDVGSVVSFLDVASNGNLLVGYSTGAFGVWRIDSDGHACLTTDGQVPAEVRAISPDGRYVACLGESYMLHLHDLEAPSQPAALYTGSTRRDINSVAVSGDGQRLAIAAGSWRIQGHCTVIIARIQPSATEPTTLIKESEFGAYSNPTADVTGMAFSHDGQALAFCDTDGELFYSSSNLGKVLHHYAEAGFTCCSLSKDGQLVLAGDKAGFVHLLAVESETLDSMAARTIPVGVKFVQNDDHEEGVPSEVLQAPAIIGSVVQPTDHGDYRGVALTAAESQALRDLEELLGIPIPAISERELSFTVKAGHVVSLRCQGKHLVTLPESIGNLRWLQTLEFEKGLLQSLPESLGQLTKLSKLVVRDTQLEALPASVGDLDNLSFLDLSSNLLSELPSSIGGLQALADLDLQTNALTALPATIGRLRALKRFTLTANRLTSLPDSIGELQSLEELRLDINQLLELPSSIGGLSSLRLLNAASNLLESLPESIGLLERLVDLDLHANRLSALPDSLGNLRSLTKLFAHDNRLTAVPAALWSLGRLVTLRLDDNHIACLPQGAEQLEALTELDLLGNRLAEFGGETGRAIKALRGRGCSVRIGPLPHRVIVNSFGPTAFIPGEPDVVWGFDLDGRLLAVNVNDGQEQRHLAIPQPVKDLAYLVRERLWMVVDDSGTLSYYSPREARVDGTFRYELQQDQHLAAVRCIEPDRVALVFTHSSHQPAMLVVHAPYYSKREVAKRDLGLGYFLSVPLVNGCGREVITTEGKHGQDLVVLDLDTLRLPRRFTGSKTYMLSARLVDRYLIGTNAEELIIWHYATGEIVYRGEFELVSDIAWSAEHQLAFLCSRFYILVLDLSTGRFLGTFDKLPDLHCLQVLGDGELLVLSRPAYGDEREKLEAETPQEIRRRVQKMAQVTYMSENQVPLTEVCQVRKMLVWRITAIRKYFDDLAETK